MATAKRPVTRKGKPAERRRHPPDIQARKIRSLASRIRRKPVFGAGLFGLAKNRAIRRRQKGTLSTERNLAEVEGLYETPGGKEGFLIKDRRLKIHKYGSGRVRTRTEQRKTKEKKNKK